MTRIANTVTRSYRSELRAEQAQETRSRILDAAVRVMAEGIASLSVPAVAREAGVSVPTVYRHFATKDELLAATYPHVVRRAGLNEVVQPRTIDGVRDLVRGIIGRIESFDDLARAAMASPAAEEARLLSVPARLDLSRKLVDTVDPPLAAADRDRIARLLVVLTTSSALRTWRDHLGVSVDDTADDIDWILRAAIESASSRRRR
ncbi:MAG TPA: helix-turn-helix domain-containing protein [Candidatus Limnocylindria bacterium]|nr:helix-turn-helix domain-containing protein [Candidatus Limnocylindria bacterium]